VCVHCNTSFIAKTTVTKFCSKKCNSAAYKSGLTAAKIDAIKGKMIVAKSLKIEEIKVKDFLTVRDVATLLNCSLRTTYRLIDEGKIPAINFSQRKLTVSRKHIDNMFAIETEIAATPQAQDDATTIDVADCYSLNDIEKKFNLSSKAVYDIIKRNNIPKIKKGWYTYVPKSNVHKIMNRNESNVKK
jgi:excisionase family DNA binding protein